MAELADRRVKAVNLKLRGLLSPLLILISLFSMPEVAVWADEPSAATERAGMSAIGTQEPVEPKWPWYLPPPDPNDPPLPEGLPSLQVIHWLGWQLEQGQFVGSLTPDMTSAHEWKAPSWCLRWEDGCEVCERNRSRSKASCRPNKRWQASGTFVCQPRLRQTLCTGIDVSIFEMSCPAPQVAVYANKVGIGVVKPKILTYRSTYFPIKILKYEYGRSKYTNINDFVNNSENIRNIKFYISDILNIKMNDFVISGGYLIELVSGSADRYLFFRLEAGRYFACLDHYMEGH